MTDIWTLKRRALVRLDYPITITIYGRETRQVWHESPPSWEADAWIWYGPDRAYIPRYWEEEMFSEGVLNDPINPDYMPPKAEVTYEVEIANEGTRWVRTIQAEQPVKDLERAEEIRLKMIGVGYKARIIRVETIRSQVS